MSKISISIIDDNEDISAFLQHKLHDNMRSINIFNCPEEALDSEILYRSDIVICDYDMPKLNGYELRKKHLEEEVIKSYFIFYTAQPQTVMRKAPKHFFDLIQEKRSIIEDCIVFNRVSQKIYQEKFNLD